MLMTSYKKVVKELPDFELIVDKSQMVELKTKLETTLNWRGTASIVLKEEEKANVTLKVLRKDVTIFEETFLTEEKANEIMFQKVEHLKQMVELECIFIL